MIEFLDSVDKELLLALNNDYCSFWDGIMFGFSEKLTWVPLYLSLIFLIFKKWKKQAWIILVALVLCIVIADQVASGVLKDLVKRFRPSRDPSLEGLVEIVNNYRGGKYGFVSSHASNSFGLALLTSLLFRSKFYSVTIFCWALVNAYSRVYLGVHYPGDILGGIIVGLGAAWLIYWLLKRFGKVSLDVSISTQEAVIPFGVLLLSIVGLLAYTLWFFPSLG